MKHLRSFEGPTVGLTKPYRYQVMYLDTLDRVQLHYRAPGQRWDIGHGKDVPASMDAQDVAEIMHEYILGDITLAEYNALLPH